MTSVTILGVGPGDPELLTLKALNRLRECDIVFYTGSLISEDVKKLFQDKTTYDTATMTMEEIVRKVKEEVEQGKKVCIAHDGDPSIYGAISEEISFLEREGINAEIIPGISSFQLSASLLGIELTCPGGPQSIIITRLPYRTSYERRMVLDRNSTVVIFLSIHLINLVQEELLKVFPPDQPVAVVYRAGWRDQLILRGKLEELERMVKESRITKTALIVVSECLRFRGDRRSNLYSPDFVHSYRGSK
ncbi:Uroporphyrin-III C/tetrapyrrole (Corrin/Porphyrin) methyltransferase [Metallosphaera sedula]|uniref:Uroporphyrin-III C/tetrapyrrole (Corrin/Porphyrin) methyltransferase n=2 Tax=Metallosphaera sedula TaxID=43687 RepID=A4YEL7_METS5|nr:MULTISPECIES: cobalt-precorrin-4/precorrin-4 C(11)-methyltransferase [Metallosphaera]ABP94869.1 Uroporphyrin-III C/tetrapyrrole (Corrin/Porphyrin) methyltransferase [Metallosphaera sedula DSM 5348]AIM26856.1 Uroporphyrin-III C/tetrapyrrole (Corrin/Porphyrin) methyltransferase [Metallosphaera sedula]AKV73799.1 uroporphyrin-III methyltransferase [Metallosphaera sedula]AKV76039.1 uroporphyrin-III methyltransferase [Metallosphaera sedula]AKV78290.1 uroporphyrin-III methyltransferase [Metallosph